MSTTPELLPYEGFRAQAIWHGVSGLPEDRYVNVFHFRKSDGGQTRLVHGDEIAEAIRSFYMDLNGGTGNDPLTEFLSNGAIDEARGLEVRVYDLEDQEPRPVSIHTFPATGFVATSGLPNEVAVVLSYYAQRNIPRQRGRIYLGPLNANAMATHQAGGDMGPSDPLRYALRAAAGRLRAATTLWPWAVYSRKAGAMYDITGGWVDNSFDTQRRRGIQASTRETWPLP